MRQSGKNQKRTIAVLLTGLFMVQQTMGLSVFAASTISGVTNGGSGSFNIELPKTMGRALDIIKTST